MNWLRQFNYGAILPTVSTALARRRKCLMDKWESTNIEREKMLHVSLFQPAWVREGQDSGGGRAAVCARESWRGNSGGAGVKCGQEVEKGEVDSDLHRVNWGSGSNSIANLPQLLPGQLLLLGNQLISEQCRVLYFLPGQSI